MPQAGNVYAMGGLQPAINPEDAVLIAVRAMPSLTNVKAGTVLGETTLSQDTVQTLTPGTGTAGTFTLTFRGATTTALAFGATAAQIATALNALPTIGASGVGATGGPVGNTGANVVITFSGSNFAKQPVEAITVDGSLISAGAIGALTVTTVGQASGFYTPYVTGGSNGAQTAKAIAKYKFSTDAAGNITFGETPTGEDFGQTRLTMPVYISGNFRIEDLVTTGTNALDATGLGQLNGHVVAGTLASGAGLLRIG